VSWGSARRWSCDGRGLWAAEPLALVVLVLSYIWIWKGAFPHARAAVVAGYFAIGIAAHRRRGEGARDIGLRLDTAREAGRLVLRWLALPAAAVLVTGLVAGWWRPIQRPLPSVAWHLAWGTAQEYGLLAVIFRGLDLAWPGGWRAEVASGLAFAACHLPNPFLAPVTGFLGTVGARIYRRAPNLPVMGATHAALGLILGHAVPERVTVGMRVGPAVLRALGSG